MLTLNNTKFEMLKLPVAGVVVRPWTDERERHSRWAWTGCGHAATNGSGAAVEHGHRGAWRAAQGGGCGYGHRWCSSCSRGGGTQVVAAAAPAGGLDGASGGVCTHETTACARMVRQRVHVRISGDRRRRTQGASEHGRREEAREREPVRVWGRIQCLRCFARISNSGMWEGYNLPEDG